MTAPSTPNPPRSRNARWWLLALGLAFAWVVFASAFLKGRNGGDLAAPGLTPTTPGDRADYAWTLEDLDGKPVEFGRFKGRAVFLNLWATWCGPCLDELPAIASLAANPRLKGVAFACVSTDGDVAELRRFVAEHKLKLPVYRASSLPLAFQTEGIPATFLIGPDGKVVASEVGAAQWDHPDVVDLLERLSKPAGASGEGVPKKDR